MTIEFTLPELGENIQSGEVVTVLVSVGDTITEDDPVLEIETDKATVEVPSSVSGTVSAVRVKEGDTVQVGQVILTADAVDEVAGVTATPEPETKIQPTKAVTEPSPPPAAGPPSPPPEAPLVEASAPAIPTIAEFKLPAALDWLPRPEMGMVPAAPNVRRIAREIGVDLTAVVGTGPGGRISMDDVKRHAHRMLEALRAGVPLGAAVGRPTPQLPDFSRWGEVERQSMSNIRRATARQMDLAWSTIPHVTQFGKADIAELDQLRKRFASKVAESGGKLTITAILLKVIAAALKEFPQFNASLDMDREEIVYKHYYHIGVAVDTDRGLLVPVIRNVDQKNIMELAIELGQVAEQARNKKLTLEDMQGGTFTLTNLGGIGGTNFTPIVNSPEVAILGVARGRVEPVFKNGQFEPRLMLPLALSYDHRLIDGADGARFLRWIVEYLEQPFLTALQGW